MSHANSLAQPITNPCVLCAPLGSVLALKGISRCVPLLHGSQGCATYIRRYLISHFREPVDAASSSFDESSVIFGGKDNLFQAMRNVEDKYHPNLIGVATTCLSETIGDDPKMFFKEYDRLYPDHVPLVAISTASYRMGHSGGFRDTLTALLRRFAGEPAGHHPLARSSGPMLNLMPGMVSPEEIRYLKELAAGFRIPLMCFPDYSETLDAPVWGEYQPLAPGGTELDMIRSASDAAHTAEFFLPGGDTESPGNYLKKNFGVPELALPYPLGMEATDRFMDFLSSLSGQSMPQIWEKERGRLIDAMIDAHKYLYGVRVAITAREELAVGLVRFVKELGMEPVLCASGSREGRLREVLEASQLTSEEMMILDDTDYDSIGRAAAEKGAELLIGSSKLYKCSREMSVPLIRLDFPIHDRFGGQRQMAMGYRGSQIQLDRIVNAIIERRQNMSDVGYTYL